MISYDEFSKIELRVGTVLTAERVLNSEKLLKLSINLGEESPRQIIAGIGKAYEPESLIGRQIIVVANLEPRMLMGLESQGMVLAAVPTPVGIPTSVGNVETPVILLPEKEVIPGSKIK